MGDLLLLSPRGRWERPEVSLRPPEVLRHRGEQTAEPHSPPTCSPRARRPGRKHPPEKCGGSWASCRVKRQVRAPGPEMKLGRPSAFPGVTRKGIIACSAFPQAHTYRAMGEQGSPGRVPGTRPQGDLWAKPQTADAPRALPRHAPPRRTFLAGGAHTAAASVGAARAHSLSLDRPPVRGAVPRAPHHHLCFRETVSSRPPSRLPRACLTRLQGCRHMPGTSPALQECGGGRGPGGRR